MTLIIFFYWDDMGPRPLIGIRFRKKNYKKGISHEVQ
jgi:hypothetical protein